MPLQRAKTKSPAKRRGKGPPAVPAAVAAAEGKAGTAQGAASDDEAWIAKLDLKAFKADMRKLGSQLQNEEGPADVEHLERVIMWSHLVALAGMALLWLPVYTMVPSVLVALGITSRWTMVAHHVCHGGYDRASAGKYERSRFAVGTLWRRFVDWFDWMLPEAWNVEHNLLHHYHLGEDTDPDLVERNLATLRESKAPLPFKYLGIAVLMATWKWYYYAPNTFKELRVKEETKKDPVGFRRDLAASGFDMGKPVLLGDVLLGLRLPWFIVPSDFLLRAMLPYLAFHFIVLPLPFALMGASYFQNAVANLVLADILANIHGFAIIVTNHCGSDLYKFDSHCSPKSGAFYLRAVVSSVAFDAGSEVVDWLSGYLNYQVEHHCFPDLSMRSYKKAMPLVKQICKKHGVPYIQESVITRLAKTARIMTGEENQRAFPEWLLAAPEE